jgi:hypothetical protein
MGSLPFRDSKIVGDSVKKLHPESIHRNILNPIVHHNAILDGQYAIREWLQMDNSPLKRYQLTLLLKNPTIKWNVEDIARSASNSERRLKVWRSITEFDDPRAINHRRQAIDQAAELGDTESVAKMVEKGLKVTDSTLMAAAESGNVWLLDYLIESSGIQPNNYTLVGAVMSGGRMKMVKYLIEDRNMKVNVFALSMSARIASLEIIKYFLSKVDRGVNLFAFFLRQAASGGRLDVFQYILTTPGLITHKFLTPIAKKILLIDACKSGSIELVEYLVNEFHLLPTVESLDQATKMGNLELVQYLIQTYGLIPNDQTFATTLKSDFFNPKSDFFNPDLVRYFADKFSMIPSIDFLYKAGETGDLDFAKYLMDVIKIKPNKQLLEVACAAGKKDFAIYLIEKKNIIPDDFVLRNAAYGGNLEMVKYLISYGLKPEPSTIASAMRGATEANDGSQIIQYINEILNAVSKSNLIS